MRMQVIKNRLLPLLLLTPLICTANFSAQSQEAAAPRALTAADYARAEKFLGYYTNPLVYHAVRPKWTTDERLWYRDTDAAGARFVIFDPAKLKKEPAFDHAKLAAALSAASGRTYEAAKLPFRETEFSADGRSVSFRVGRRRFKCDRQGVQCTEEAGAAGTTGRRGGASNEVPSPDKKMVAFIREYNLWVRDAASGKETQLTTDGIKDFSYALDNAGWRRATGPSCCGRPTQRRLPPTNRTSATWATCTWWRRKLDIQRSKHGSTRCPETTR